MEQGEDLRQHLGISSDEQPQSTDEPDHHQIQQSNQHTDDRYHESRNPAHRVCDDFWHGTAELALNLCSLIGMTQGHVLEAFRLEAQGLSWAVAGLSEHEW